MREEQAEHRHDDRTGSCKQEGRGRCLDAELTYDDSDHDPPESAEHAEQGETARVRNVLERDGRSQSQSREVAKTVREHQGVNSGERGDPRDHVKKDGSYEVKG